MARPRIVMNYDTSRPEAPGVVSVALLESLERSKAQAGLSVPLEPALDRLRASIARMKAKRAEPE